MPFAVRSEIRLCHIVFYNPIVTLLLIAELFLVIYKPYCYPEIVRLTSSLQFEPDITSFYIKFFQILT